VPIHPVRSVPLALNSYAIWVLLMIGLTITNYGFPIVTLAAHRDTSVPAVYVGAQ
jgi:cytochrome c oxidase subunit I